MKTDSISYYREMVGENFTKIKKFLIIPELLNYDLKEFKDLNAVSWHEHHKTYQELINDVAKVRALFIDKGLKKGDHVAMIFKNEYNFVKTFLALTSLGMVAVIIPPMLPKEALMGSLKKFDVKAIVYMKEIQANVDFAKGDLLAISSLDLENLNSEAPADFTIKPLDPAAIIFTGGTTGTPKGAVLSHRALLRGSYNGCFMKGPIFNNNYMVLIPFFHVFGLVRNLLTSMNTGSNVYLIKEITNFINEVKEAKPNIMVVVPALADMLYSVVKNFGISAVGGNLKYIVAGGAHVTPSSILRLHEVGIECCPGYGLTESANLVSGSINNLDKPESVGIVYPEQEVKLVNGEIWVKGDNLFDGYYNDLIETQKVLTNDGYLKTGDLGKFDEDGFLYITGRSKNIIVLDNGENVSPEIIENALDNVSLIHSSLVFEDKNDLGRSVIAAKIYPNYNMVKKLGIDNVEGAINDAVKKVNEQLEKHMCVTKVIILKDDFKRSGSMKIIRKENI